MCVMDQASAIHVAESLLFLIDEMALRAALHSRGPRRADYP